MTTTSAVRRRGRGILTLIEENKLVPIKIRLLIGKYLRITVITKHIIGKTTIGKYL